MNKMTFSPKKSAAALLAALCAAMFFPACAKEKNDIWTDNPVRRGIVDRKTQKQKAAHLRRVLNQVVLVRMNSEGEICIGEDDSVLLQPYEFARQIGEIGKATPGKPVLFFYDEEAATAQPGIRAFIIRECNRAKLGRIYTEVPDSI